MVTFEEQSQGQMLNQPTRGVPGLAGQDLLHDHLVRRKGLGISVPSPCVHFAIAVSLFAGTRLESGQLCLPVL